VNHVSLCSSHPVAAKLAGGQNLVKSSRQFNPFGTASKSTTVYHPVVAIEENCRGKRDVMPLGTKVISQRNFQPNDRMKHGAFKKYCWVGWHVVLHEENQKE
jgi:hypothetical protein